MHLDKRHFNFQSFANSLHFHIFCTPTSNSRKPEPQLHIQLHMELQLHMQPPNASHTCPSPFRHLQRPLTSSSRQVATTYAQMVGSRFVNPSPVIGQIRAIAFLSSLLVVAHHYSSLLIAQHYLSLPVTTHYYSLLHLTTHYYSLLFTTTHTLDGTRSS